MPSPESMNTSYSTVSPSLSVHGLTDEVVGGDGLEVAGHVLDPLLHHARVAPLAPRLVGQVPRHDGGVVLVLDAAEYGPVYSSKI